MRHDVLKEVEKKNKAHKRMRKWYVTVTCLAVLVALCTVYALIVPAIALEKDLICTMQEHQHAKECYTLTEGENILVCDVTEHVHDDKLCYESMEKGTGEETTAETAPESELSGESETMTETAGETEGMTETPGETETEGMTDAAGESDTEATTEPSGESETEVTTEPVTETEEETTTEIQTGIEDGTAAETESENAAGIYHYEDDSIQVDVQLSKDSNVPVNAVLKVTTIGASDGHYSQLTQQAMENLPEEIRQIVFYDISFYGVEGEYIPVDNQAKVTMRLKDNIMDKAEEKSDIVVLHYDEENKNPVVLDTASETQEEPGDSKAVSTFSMTEEKENFKTGMTVTFETDGFSTFAVVEVETDTYLTTFWKPTASNNNVVDDSSTVSGLSNKTFVIASETKDLLISSVNTLVDGNDMLKGMGVPDAEEEENQLITYANDNILWQFEPTGHTGTVYIKSVATGKYLNIIRNNILLTTDEKQEITVVMNGTSVGFCVEVEGVYYYIDNDGGGDHYHTWTGGITDDNDRNRRFRLFAYGEDSRQEDTTEVITGLDSKVYMVVAVNNANNDKQKPPALSSSAGEPTGDNRSQLTGQNVQNITYEGNKVTSVTDNDDNNDLGWYFEGTDTPGAYYLRIVNEGNERIETGDVYLNIGAGGLVLSQNPQAIEVVKANTEGDGCYVKEDVVCLRADIDGQDYYVVLNANDRNKDFTSFAGEGTDYTSYHFVLTEILPDAEGVPTVNEVVAMIEDLLQNLEKDGDSYVFSNAAFTGAAEEKNKNDTKSQGNGGQNHDETFVDDYNQAVLYRSEMQRMAREAKAAYEKIENAETENNKQARYVYRADILMESLKWLWYEPATVEPVDVNAKVELFNYDGTTNDPNHADSNGALLGAGFRFYHKSNYDSYTAIVASNRNNTNKLGCNGSDMDMYDTLINGYPSVKGSDEQGIALSEQEGSMEFLFDDTYHVATMDDGTGGGLFRKDAEGYYYYNCAENAAYYDPDENKFKLYDTIIRPMYIHGTNPNSPFDIYNFLPFNDPAAGVVYDDPVDDKEGGLLNNTAYLNQRPDLWFGMTIEFDFIMPENGKINTGDGQFQEMLFQFEGDDDVLVYIDDRLVMDIAGVHGAEEGMINFATGEVVDTSDNTADSLKGIFTELSGETFDDNTIHTLKFYYMERGGNVSYNYLRFNIPTLPQKHLKIGKEVVEPDDSPKAIDEKYYTFRVAQADAGGSVLKDADGITLSFLKPGTSYNIMDGEEIVGSGTVKEDGTFSLKAGYYAYFTNILDDSVRLNNKCGYYVVQEMIPKEEDGQYSEVAYTVEQTDEIEMNRLEEQGQQGNDVLYVYSSKAFSISDDNEMVVKNKIAPPLGTLTITKKLESALETETESFTIQVKTGDAASGETDPAKYMHPLPKGTAYTLKRGDAEPEAKIIENDNGYITLQKDDIITIEGFIAGTQYEVLEVLENEQKYIPKYTGTVKTENKDPVEITFGEQSAGGEFGIGETVEVTVTNYDYDCHVEIPISKEVMYGKDTDTFTFDVKSGTWDETTKTFTEDGKAVSIRSNSITVRPGDGVTAHPKLNGEIIITYVVEDLSENPVLYYKVSENKGANTNYIYDDTYYIVKVEISENDGVKTAAVTGIWKNGTDEITPATSTLPFVNYRTTSVTITKTVSPATTEETFGFTVSAVDTEGNSIELAQGDGSFTLKHGEKKVISGIPIGAIVTVKESGTDGYTPTYRIKARFEAEYGELQDATVFYDENVSDGFYVSALTEDEACSIPIHFAASANAGMYFRYASDEAGTLNYKTDGVEAFSQTMPAAAGWTNLKANSAIHVSEGKNTLTMGGSTAAMKLDYVDLESDTVNGDTATINVLGDNTVIEFINMTYYELPQAGGTGNGLYVLGGLLTMMSALALLLLYNKKTKEIAKRTI